jgi:hypothetical protein
MKIKCSECSKFFDDKHIYLTDTDYMTLFGDKRIFARYLCKKCLDAEGEKDE